jgi:nucleoside-diphosphate-sugar epimerase
MILVTGSTGFIGKALVNTLLDTKEPVRILLRPSRQSPNIPKGVTLDVAMCSLADERGLKAAMKNVDCVYHLAGSERRGAKADLSGVDINGTDAITRAAKEAGIRRLVFLSHLGADKHSAYALLRTKAIAEGLIQGSGITFTILRCAPVYGPGDQFTTHLEKVIRTTPFATYLPEGGSSTIQPIWIQDVINCLILAGRLPELENQVLSIGGSEYFTFRQVIEMIMENTGVRKKIVGVSSPTLRIFSLLFESVFKSAPISIYWLDYLATDHTCALDVLPRTFGLLPARMSYHLDYLQPSSHR